MKNAFDFYASRQTSRRHLAGMAGIATAAVSLASVLALFADASSMPWLTPTSRNLALIQRCDGVDGRAARQVCIEAVVAARTHNEGVTLALTRATPGAATQAR
jgi:hypothetical protein